MAKLWAKVNGTWVSLGAQSKDDVGLGNVQNFTFTNSATDGSSDKYATGAALKEAYDNAKMAEAVASSGATIGGVSTTRDLSLGGWPQFCGLLDANIPSNGLWAGLTHSGLAFKLKYRRF